MLIGLLEDGCIDIGTIEYLRVGTRDGRMILGEVIGFDEGSTDGVTVRPTVVGPAVTVGFRVGTSDGLIEGVVDGTSVGCSDVIVIEGYIDDSTEGLLMVGNAVVGMIVEVG